jgi:hypothetical protein
MNECPPRAKNDAKRAFRRWSAGALIPLQDVEKEKARKGVAMITCSFAADGQAPTQSLGPRARFKCHGLGTRAAEGLVVVVDAMATGGKNYLNP